MRNIEFLKKNGVDTSKITELFGDIAIYNETMQDYLNGIEEKKSLLERYKNAKDWANYAIYAHSIKSDARYLGFLDVAQICYEHEMAGKTSNQHFIENNYGKIISATDRMTRVVMEYLNGNDNEEVIGTPTANEVNQVISTAKKDVVLIADDSSIISNLIERAIKDKYAIIKAANGQEVLNYFNANEYNILCLLLDLNMPVMDGFAVLEYMKTNNLFSKIPVSVITGEDTKDGINRAFSYGIVDVLNKPFGINEVLSTVNKTINRY